MAQLGPPQVVPAPGISAFPAGLLVSAQVIDHGEDDQHWGNFVEFMPDGCSDPLVLDPCDLTTAHDNTRNRPGKIAFEPFGVDAYDSCSSFGFESAEYEQRALRALTAREGVGLEAEFWTGSLFGGANPALARAAAPANGGPAATVLNGGTAVGLSTALAMLVQAIADTNGGKGMIHARPFIVELWLSQHLINNGPLGKMETFTGIPIVAGAGYPGSSPAGVAPTATAEWAFATDNVVVHRGPVEVFGPGINGGSLAQYLDRTTNLVSLRAQRLMAPLFNGCTLAAVKINTTVPF